MRLFLLSFLILFSISGIGQSGSIIEQGGGGGATSLTELSDVTITTPTNGQVLEYNGSIWVNATAGGGMSSWTLSGDGGTPQTITDGESVSFIGGTGITTTAGATDQLTIDWSAAINDLSDVTVTTPSNTQVLKYNGSAWVNAADSIGTDDQQIANFSLATNILTLEIENDGQAPQTVDLSGYLDNTDAQTLSIDSTGAAAPRAFTISISGGNSISFSDTGGGGSMSSWTAAGDGGTPQTITDGNTLTLVGGTGITTTAAATDQVTIDWSANINDLGDVTITTPSTDQVLKYNGSIWVNGTDAVDDADNSITNELQTLSWTDGTNTISISGGNAEVITGFMEDFILTADSGVNQTVEDAETMDIAGGTNISTVVGATNTVTINWSAAINDLSDVTITTPSNGQVLQYNGSIWVNAAGGGGSSIYTGDGTLGAGSIVDVTVNQGDYINFNLDGASAQTIFGIRVTTDYSADDAFSYYFKGVAPTDSMGIYAFDNDTYITEEGGSLFLNSTEEIGLSGVFVNAQDGLRTHTITTAERGGFSYTTADRGTIFWNFDDTNFDYWTGTAWAKFPVTNAMTSWTFAATTGPAQSITNGNVATIIGGPGLASVASATDNVTINMDWSELAVDNSPLGTDYLVFYDVDAATHDRVAISSLPGGSGMTSFTISGNAGTPQTITDGNTITFVGNNGVETTASATDQMIFEFYPEDLATQTTMSSSDYVILDPTGTTLGQRILAQDMDCLTRYMTSTVFNLTTALSNNATSERFLVVPTEMGNMCIDEVYWIIDTGTTSNVNISINGSDQATQSVTTSGAAQNLNVAVNAGDKITFETKSPNGGTGLTATITFRCDCSG